MKFATVYTRKEERSRSYATENLEPSMTQQADAKDCDINVIMSRYRQTGQLPRQLMQPLFGDFTETPDYAAAVTTIRAAEDAFLQVPAKIRAQFGNDPGEFIKFASNPANKEELLKMGLLKPERRPTIEEQTLTAIKEHKPISEIPANGTGQK